MGISARPYPGVVVRTGAERATLVRRTYSLVFASILVSALERAHTYAALRASNTRYDQLALRSRIVNWEVDARGLYTYLSPAVEQVWGYRPEELVGRKYFFDLLPAPVRTRFQTEILHYFECRDFFKDYVNPLACGDGRTIWVLTNGFPVLAQDGTLLGYRGSDVDVTESHRAREQLRESEARLSAIFENAPIGIAMVGPNRRLSLVNRMLADFLGYAPQDLIGMAFDALTYAEDFQEDLRLFEELVAGKRDAYRLAKRFLKADGTLVWGDLRVVLLPSASSGRMAAKATLISANSSSALRMMRPRIGQVSVSRMGHNCRMILLNRPSSI